MEAAPPPPLREASHPSPAPPEKGISLGLAAAILLALHGGLLLLFDLAHHLIPALLLLAAAFLTLARAARRRGAARGATPAFLLLVAAGLRLVLLPLPPTLSDDILRYLWDGRVILAGANPYLLAPEAEELVPLRDDLWRRLPHRQVPTVYPPLAEGAFALAAALPASAIVLKLLLVLADLGACALLLDLTARLDLPRERVLWYAWNPLVCLEVAGMGHIDALAVAAAVAAVWALAARRPATAAGAAAAGVLAKLGPLAALPLWSRHSRRPALFLGLTGVVLAATLGPVVALAGGVPPGLTTYGVSWEFNGPLYEPLWRLLEAVDSRALGEAVLDRLKLWSGDHELWNRFYPFNYARLHAKLLLAAAALGWLAASWRAGRRWGLVAGTGRLFGGLLLCSATVYPWYLLWVLPWAALAGRRSWLALGALLPLAYLPQHLEVPLMPWIFAAIWLPFSFLLLRDPRWPTC